MNDSVRFRVQFDLRSSTSGSRCFWGFILLSETEGVAEQDLEEASLPERSRI